MKLAGRCIVNLDAIARRVGAQMLLPSKLLPPMRERGRSPSGVDEELCRLIASGVITAVSGPRGTVLALCVTVRGRSHGVLKQSSIAQSAILLQGLRSRPSIKSPEYRRA
jgi:hypothetical protein